MDQNAGADADHLASTQGHPIYFWLGLAAGFCFSLAMILSASVSLMPTNVFSSALLALLALLA